MKSVKATLKHVFGTCSAVTSYNADVRTRWDVRAVESEVELGVSDMILIVKRAIRESL